MTITKKKLTALPRAQTYVQITDSGDVYLFSYNTLVAAIVNKWVVINGLYRFPSITTRRHIGAFMKEYVNSSSSFHTAKLLYDQELKLNVETGEIKEAY